MKHLNKCEWLELPTEEKGDYFKRAVYDLIFDGPQSAKEIAYELGKAYHRVQSWTRRDDENHHIPPHCLIKTSLIQNNFDVIDRIETILGRVAFTIPEEVPDLAEVCQEFGRMIQEFGDVTKEYGEAIDDGKLDGEERARLRKEILELMRQAGVFLKAVEAE